MLDTILVYSRNHLLIYKTIILTDKTVLKIINVFQNILYTSRGLRLSCLQTYLMAQIICIVIIILQEGLLVNLSVESLKVLIIKKIIKTKVVFCHFEHLKDRLLKKGTFILYKNVFFFMMNLNSDRPQAYYLAITQVQFVSSCYTLYIIK